MGRLLAVLLVIAIISGILPVFGQNTVPDIASLFHPSLSQASEQSVISNATNFASTNESNVFAYPNIGVGTTTPAFSLLPSITNPLISSLGSTNSKSFDKATTDLGKMDIPDLLPSLTSTPVISPAAATGLTPVTYGFPVIASSGSSTAFNQASTSITDKETFDFDFLRIAPSIPAPTPRPRIAYVSNSADNTVLVINTATNSVIATILVGVFPTRIAFTPDGTRAYVINGGGNTVSVIDTATNSVINTISSPQFNNPVSIVVTPDGARAYITNLLNNIVAVIRLSDNTVTGISSPQLNNPAGIAINPAGTQVYVTNYGPSNSVSVIDTSTNTVRVGPGYPIPVGTSPGSIAVNPAGTRAYVTNTLSNNVYVINLGVEPPVVSSIISLLPQTYPYSIAFTPNGAYAYVPDQNSNSVSVIRTSDNSVTAITTGFNAPAAVAVKPDGTQVYVTNVGDGTVSVIRTSDNTVIDHIAVGNNPYGVAFYPT